MGEGEKRRKRKEREDRRGEKKSGFHALYGHHINT